MGAIDVYSYGVVASSTLYRVQGLFPAAEGYAELSSVQYMTGGEAANSSIVLSRLGARVKLDGNWLGDDDGGKRTRAFLNDCQIDASRLGLKEGYVGVQEVVFAAQGTRTIFGSYCQLLENRDWNMPNEEDVKQAKVICLDPFFEEASSRVAEIGGNESIPIVTIDCRHGDPLLQQASAVVIAESYIRENYAEQQREKLFREYQQNTNGLVIFTFGNDAIWYARPDETLKTFQPYSIEAEDTSGAGDAFRAGIVFGFLREWDDDQMVDFAAAVAALVCLRSPGVLHSPNYDEVQYFRYSERR